MLFHIFVNLAWNFGISGRFIFCVHRLMIIVNMQRETFSWFSKLAFKIQQEKARSFSSKEIEYLGFMINSENMAMSLLSKNWAEKIVEFLEKIRTRNYQEYGKTSKYVWDCLTSSETWSTFSAAFAKWKKYFPNILNGFKRPLPEYVMNSDASNIDWGPACKF